MKTSSSKAKGRRYQKEIAQCISDITGIAHGKDCLIESREMGQAGVDIRLIGDARTKFPWSVECKCCERFNIPVWIRQASCNMLPDTNWLLLFKRNRTPGRAIMSSAAFETLLAEPDIILEHTSSRWSVDSLTRDVINSESSWVLYLSGNPDLPNVVCMSQKWFFELYSRLLQPD